MPWTGSTYIRTDGTYNGQTVWFENFSNNIKIVYSRHDTHDQDIADGITACLNKNGANSPSANLPMGWVQDHRLRHGIGEYGRSEMGADARNRDTGRRHLRSHVHRQGRQYDYHGATSLPISGGGGGGAPTDATYVTLSTNGSLSNERVSDRDRWGDILYRRRGRKRPLRRLSRLPESRQAPTRLQPSR
jgi:hypothetical protein